jgi:hypothetical protein
MSDEKDAAPRRLTELAQGLNRIDAARYPAIAAKNLSQLPPHLLENLPAVPATKSPASVSK